MRDIFAKLMTGSMVAGAALLVAACGGSENTATTDTNMMEMNTMDTSMEGSMNDVTAVDATMGSDNSMMMDNTSVDNSASSMNGMDNMAGNGM